MTNDTTGFRQCNDNVQNNPDNIRPAVSRRTRRANDLARAIEDWAVHKTERSFRVAVWGIGVDAVFGNAVFVPVAFAVDGRVIIVSSVWKNGRKLYRCDIDLPSKYEQDCLAYAEMELMDFIKLILNDDDATGVSIRLDDKCFLVDRGYLEDLLRKINGLSARESDR